MEELKCDICGQEFKNKQQRGSHYWNQHKIKYSEYAKQKASLSAVIDEASRPDTAYTKPIQESVAQKPAEALFQPSQITETKEFVNEAPAMVIDRELMKESERTDTDFVKKAMNPYRDLYPGAGQVFNERLDK
jgi:hypothetical protein